MGWGFVWMCAAATASAKELVFEKDVRPILKAYCFMCHGEANEREGGLDLRLARLAQQGGDSGPAVLAGKHKESLLVERIRSKEMPPSKKKVTPEELAIIQQWIDQGAKTARPEPQEIGHGPLFTEEEKAYWAFQPIQRPPVPQVKHAQQVKTPVDNFLLTRLEQEGLSYSPPASKETLIRRATYDLTGLPPTPAEIDEFVHDDSPAAYDRLLDRLLESPRYGERWGRHWLDVAGYADSEGYAEEDTERKWAYKYRDYVIHSIHADKPFDQFIQEQLAGDEMLTPPYKNLTPDQAEKLIATGFLRMAADGTGNGGVDKKAASNQVVADTVQIVSTALLGLTVGCAQCHDHRYDPIPQADYYRLRAVFEPALDWKNWRVPNARLITLYTDADRQQAAQLEAEAKQLDAARLEKEKEFIAEVFERELAKRPEELRQPLREARDTPEKMRTAEQRKLLKEHPSVNVSAGSLYLYDKKMADELKKMASDAADVRAKKPKEEMVRALSEVPGKVPQTFLHYRGDYEQPKEELQPAGLSILEEVSPAKIPAKNPELPTTGRRTAFAAWLTSGTHPLVSRVLVNRIWMHHFGRGLVASPADFGTLGERPSHPELLDWLASDFTDHGWKLKRFHKLLMSSNVYLQGTQRTAQAESIDPDNRLLWGKPLMRLEAEAVRDAMLATSGKLNEKRFGPAVPVMADLVGQWVIGKENLNAGRPGAIVDMKGEEFRRSLYVQSRRSRPLAVLDMFDLPTMAPNCEVRASSTVAPQSLMLMNSDFVMDQARHFALRVQTEAGENLTAQVTLAWRLALGTQPTAAQLHDSVTYVQDQTAQFSTTKFKDKITPSQLGLASFCQALYSANGFLYVD